MNVFQKFPQFINSDPRRHRTDVYVIDQELVNARHENLLNHVLVKNCSVLDIGCCVAATGAWVLDNGASEYIGIDIQSEFTDLAKKNLSKCFSTANWQIHNTSFEDFIIKNKKQFDIVVASGIIYSTTQYQEFIKNVSALATKAVVIESSTPSILNLINFENHSDISFYPVVEYTDKYKLLFNSTQHLSINTAIPNLGVLKILFEEQGFMIDKQSYDNLKISHKTYQDNRRFGAVFLKSNNHTKSNSVNYCYKNKENLNLTNREDIISKYYNFNDFNHNYLNYLKTTPFSVKWEFNETVADGFVNYAKKHIPDYDKIINLSINICKKMLMNPVEDKIIDIGCATGETINRLWTQGFCNLIGVDNSQAMLDKCSNKNAFYINSSTFPKENGPYNAALCNWTLHFINDKTAYLQDIYDSLTPNGFMILTDKTANSGVDLELYHDFKRSKGVSNEEIATKAESLKGVMFVDSVEWYLKTLQTIGFRSTTIINSAPCFTTFLVLK